MRSRAISLRFIARLESRVRCADQDPGQNVLPLLAELQGEAFSTVRTAEPT